MNNKTTWTPCCDGCPGWFPNEGDWGDIQRCDDCRRFADDDEAMDHADSILEAARMSDGVA